MDTIRLGRTNILASGSSFGAIPIQRLSDADATTLLRGAYDGGINFYDTARGYTDSEEKIGRAFAGLRDKIYIATKSFPGTVADFEKNLETSLTNLQTDYVDIYQFHNPSFLIGEDHELYQAALKAKKAGKMRYIGVTSHRADLAMEEVESGLFDTMQFPLSALSDEKDFALAAACKNRDVGFIAMKAMSGGLITDPTATFALLRSVGNVVPIWGIQHIWELEQFLALEANPPTLDSSLLAQIEKDKQELGGAFCRGCGYCQPTCPAKIQISMAARISLLLRRTSPDGFVTADFQSLMERIEDCTDCGLCRGHCPYGLDTPALLKTEYISYKKYLRDNGIA